MKEARIRALYDEDGNLVTVFERLLELVDEREVEKSKLPFAVNSPTLMRTARQFVDGGERVRRPSQGAIIQMLDIGADPERLRQVFMPEAVDRELARWRPWRADVLALARKKATAEEIRAAVPPYIGPSGERQPISWKEIQALLRLHGFVYDDVKPRTPGRVIADAKRLLIMTEYQKGGTIKQVAERAGCTVGYVKTLVRGVRTGHRLYAGLEQYLERAA